MECESSLSDTQLVRAADDVVLNVVKSSTSNASLPFADTPNRPVENMSTFEKEHYHPANVLPDRPCTAFFFPSQWIDTSVIFDALDREGFAPQCVRCLQRKPNNGVMLTFNNPLNCEKFLSLTTFNVGNGSYFVRSSFRPVTFVTVHDAPHELPDSAIIERLKSYGNVIACRRGMLPNYPGIFNGLRILQVQVTSPIPCFLRFGRLLLRFSYKGQPKTCRLCNSPDHLAQTCDRVVCFNCDQYGHVAKNCPDTVRCSVCKSALHLALHCPHSWSRRKLVAATSDPFSESALDAEVLSNDDHPSDHEYIPDHESTCNEDDDDNDDNDDNDDDDDNERMSDTPDVTPVDPNDNEDSAMLDAPDVPDATPDNLSVLDVSANAPDAAATSPDVAPPPSSSTSLSHVSPSASSSSCFLRPAEKPSYSQALTSPPVSSPELFSSSHSSVPATPPGRRPAPVSPATSPPASRQPTRPAKMTPRKRRCDTDVSDIPPKNAPT